MSYRTQSAATLKGTIAYVCQRSKTAISLTDAKQKHNVYNEIPPQGEGIKLLSGLNCTPESACSEFIATKSIYEKTDGVQFYHYTQSFKDDEDISPLIAHEIAIKFAEKHYNDYEVLVATHVDQEHLHSHFIINSVSFETGKKLHETPNTLQNLRQTSDIICKEYELSTLEPYQRGRTISRGEQKAKEQGTSWKFNLCLTIESSMKKSRTKKEFIDEMKSRNYEVTWTDERKSITYTCPNGMACRDDRLYGRKYLKENMEREFELRESNVEQSENITGWEYERKYLFAPPEMQAQMQNNQMKHLTNEILWAAKGVLYAISADDELNALVNLTMLTALSMVGAYLLVQKIQDLYAEEKLTEDNMINSIEELKLEPENNIHFEEVQIEEQVQEQEQEFTMTMM